MKTSVMILLVVFSAATIFSAGCTTQVSTSGHHGEVPVAEGDSSGSTAYIDSGNGEVRIRMKESSFDPSIVTIRKGTTVLWVNEDTLAHTVTYVGTGVKKFDSSRLEPGQSFSFVFTDPGRYKYADTQHSFMEGLIIVE